jgi:hypothetical protein
MGEGFIVRRGGGGQQTVKPIYNSLTEVGFTSLTLNVTNDSNSIATLYYSVVQTEPGPTTSDTFDTEFQGKETKDITITGLTGGTTYTVYLKAIAIGEFPSETVIVTDLTTGQAMSATGGTLNTYTSGGTTYRSHTFTGNGTFQVTQLSNIAGLNDVDYLIVAGGGGGGSDAGGGGGAGGHLVGVSTVSATSYSVLVGAGGVNGGGGSGPSAPSNRAQKGFNSSVFGVSAEGGGLGGMGQSRDLPQGTQLNGGSGGGGGGSYPSNNNGGEGGLGISGQGHNGSKGLFANETGGGGGGAGGIPPNSIRTGTALGTGQNGGPGAVNNYRTGSNETRAGGGGGGGWSGSAYPDGAGGVGGGGAGGGFGTSANKQTRVGFNGAVNTGGGAGGGNQANGGNGGSGIVIIRYEIAPV